MSRPTPQEIQDIRDQAKIDKAYEDSLRLTAPAPAASAPKPAASRPVKRAGGGVTRDETNPLRKFKKTYSPKGTEIEDKLYEIADKEGQEVNRAASKGRYFDAFKSAHKGTLAGLGAMTMGPLVGANAAVNRVVGGKRDSKEESREKAERAGLGVMKKGGVTRADGCITKGHTRGRMV